MTLFDHPDETQAARSAAAKLEGERLTAEMGSPLNGFNRRRQLKRAPVVQGDLFSPAEMPAQGRILYE